MKEQNSSERVTLRTALRERAVQRDVQVTLASGQASNFYVDCKKVTLYGPSLRALSEVFVDELEKLEPRPTAIAGVSVGGDPIVAGVIMAAAQRGWELDGLLVRKEAKKHGLSQGRAVEGPAPHLAMKVYLLEDVVSTGGSSLTAAQHLNSEGYVLSGMLCIVDREMGGREKLQTELKIPVTSLFKKADLV
jgi:orotate phosphoribosyltransferase